MFTLLHWSNCCPLLTCWHSHSQARKQGQIPDGVPVFGGLTDGSSLMVVYSTQAENCVYVSHLTEKDDVLFGFVFLVWQSFGMVSDDAAALDLPVEARVVDSEGEGEDDDKFNDDDDDEIDSVDAAGHKNAKPPTNIGGMADTKHVAVLPTLLCSFPRASPPMLGSVPVSPRRLTKQLLESLRSGQVRTALIDIN